MNWSPCYIYIVYNMNTYHIQHFVLLGNFKLITLLIFSEKGILSKVCQS